MLSMIGRLLSLSHAPKVVAYRYTTSCLFAFPFTPTSLVQSSRFSSFTNAKMSGKDKSWRSYSHLNWRLISTTRVSSVVHDRNKRRVALAAFSLLSIGSAVFLLLSVLEDNILFYVTPSQCLEKSRDGSLTPSMKFRLGGLVQQGSIVKVTPINTTFTVTDLMENIHCDYVGVLPALFQEGKSVVVQGYLQGEGSMKVTEVLAKHDENYMPPEIQAQMREKQLQAGVNPDGDLGKKQMEIFVHDTSLKDK